VTEIKNHKGKAPIFRLCEALDVPRARFYRRNEIGSLKRNGNQKSHPRKLRPEEEKEVLETMNSSKYMEKSPGFIFASLLDEGKYLCSERTMYRILDKNNQNRQRRQSDPRNAPKPELLATGPNQLWSWDISAPQQAV